jgi:hypothetical protein
MGEQLGYTYQHYTQCLHRFIGYYNPALMPIVQQLTADELGQYLMALTVPEPPKERLAAEMSRLVRNQGENLRQAVAQLKALATGYYSEYRPEESQVLTNRVMILGLANFTVGKTRQAITQMLDQAQLHNRKIDWSIILETAIKAEKLFGVPQTPMPFNPSGTAITTLFSSTFLPVDNPVQHDPSVIDISLDHNSQHKAYTDPTIISMPANNQQIRRNNPRPVAANVPRPIQIQNMPNIVQPEPLYKKQEQETRLQLHMSQELKSQWKTTKTNFSHQCKMKYTRPTGIVKDLQAYQE